MAKTGIFGGTFNPIHKGHMHLADTVSDKLSLDRLIFMPSNIPPHKSSENLCDNRSRFEMCKLAAESDTRYVTLKLQEKAKVIQYILSNI